MAGGAQAVGPDQGPLLLLSMPPHWPYSGACAPPPPPPLLGGGELTAAGGAELAAAGGGVLTAAGGTEVAAALPLSPLLLLLLLPPLDGVDELAAAGGTLAGDPEAELSPPVELPPEQSLGAIEIIRLGPLPNGVPVRA